MDLVSSVVGMGEVLCSSSEWYNWAWVDFIPLVGNNTQMELVNNEHGVDFMLGTVSGGHRWTLVLSSG